MPRHASTTADMVCFFRALELQYPPAQRILEDHFAPLMLPSEWQKKLRKPWVQAGFNTLSEGLLAPVGQGLAALMKGVSPSGLQHYVVLRHRSIDERIREFMAQGGQQVVLLGAGYDMRPYRLRDILGECPVFEVDFPATLHERESRLNAFPWLDRRHVHAVPVDFAKTTIDVALAQHPHFSTEKRTFFVWEGVAMYLESSAVNATLEAIRRLAPPNSELAFDLWMLGPALTPRGVMTRITQQILSILGEPLRFLMTKDKIAAFIENAGFELVDMASSKTLNERYGLRKGWAFPDFCVLHTRLPDVVRSSHE